MVLDNPLIPHKLELIDTAYRLKPFRSFADLGACWGVNGGYSFHTRSLCGQNFDQGYIVDQTITPLTTERALKFNDLKLTPAMLGSTKAREAVGKVDTLIMFDILLHQVAPDWDQFIGEWLPYTDTVIVYNQNWFKSKKTLRFVDCGLDWYLQYVYTNNNEEGIRDWFINHYKFNEQQLKIERDIHNWWQWGITTVDLIDLFAKNGFDLLYSNTYNNWGRHPWIINQGFVFSRSKSF